MKKTYINADVGNKAKTSGFRCSARNAIEQGGSVLSTRPTQRDRRDEAIREMREVFAGQVNKSIRRMPWHWEPKKDVISCEKLR